MDVVADLQAGPQAAESGEMGEGALGGPALGAECVDEAAVLVVVVAVVTG